MGLDILNQFWSNDAWIKYSEFNNPQSLYLIDNSTLSVQGHRSSKIGGEKMRKKTIMITTALITLLALPPMAKAIVFHYWWDNVYFVEGTDIDYPHPDNVYYDISQTSDWTKLGKDLHHHQINKDTTHQILVGSIAFFGALGIIITALLGGGTMATVVGTLTGLALGSLIDVIIDYYFVDERGCIWWWISWLFVYYLQQNLPYLSSANAEIAIAAIVGAFISYGYFRIGMVTFNDPMGIGSPHLPELRFKNPSFEERANPLEWQAGGVFKCPPWESNNGGWRNVRGDIDDDGDCDSLDLFKFREAYVEEYNWKADFDGDKDVDSYDLFIFRESYILDIPCRVSGIYSWYTNGGGDYAMWQWLDFESVQAIGGMEVTFSFRFYPASVASNGSLNYAWAEIFYVLYNGQVNTVIGNPTHPDQLTWFTASVTTDLPSNIDLQYVAVIIRGQPNFHAWIDQTSLTV